MTPLQKVKNLYKIKKQNGLKSVSVTLDSSSSIQKVDPNEIAQDILNLEEAITKGRYKPLVFNDRHSSQK